MNVCAKIFSFSVALLLLLTSAVNITPIVCTANNGIESNSYDTADNALNYLFQEQRNNLFWMKNNHNYTYHIADICEYVYGSRVMNNQDVEQELCNIIEELYILMCNDSQLNTDMLSEYILLDKFHFSEERWLFVQLQNPDGGFGLAEGYTSDIIDTKLALKALIDIGEADAMTNAALYISSLTN